MFSSDMRLYSVPIHNKETLERVCGAFTASNIKMEVRILSSMVAFCSPTFFHRMYLGIFLLWRMCGRKLKLKKYSRRKFTLSLVFDTVS